jgi:hypothetical protein
MTDLPRSAASITEPYSPQLRTALVLTGTGTAGAYHAGALRALQEAGVKIDVVAGRGIGVIGALFAAIDGAARLWEERGVWRNPGVRTLYPWGLASRIAGAAFALSLAIVSAPLAAVALGLVVFPIDFVLKMAGLASGGGLVGTYVRFAEAAFAPGALPTWLPRLVVLVLGAALIAIAVSSARQGGGRRRRGALWWRLVPPPLSADEASAHCWRVMWDLVRGAAQLKQPAPRDLARRYADLLAENFGQPGIRELLIGVHDIDAHRDLIFVLVTEPRRRRLFRRATSAEADARQAEVVDLSGLGRDHLSDAVAAALTIPVVTEPHAIHFAADGYWRGETHRLVDRPAALGRILEELTDLGVEQILVVSAAPDSAGPHALAAPRTDGRAVIGEYLQSAEAAAVRDAVYSALPRVPRVFIVRPVHNPIGPFDFGGGYDDRSDRLQPLDELMARGYEDAHRQFIEPIVAVSGERVGAL